jgi:hypothetical protein
MRERDDLGQLDLTPLAACPAGQDVQGAPPGETLPLGQAKQPGVDDDAEEDGDGEDEDDEEEEAPHVS